MVKKTILYTKALINAKRTLFTEAGKYFVVGGICTVLDFGLLFLFTHYFHVYYLASSIISFLCATVLNYYLCTIWIFKIRTVENRNLEMVYYLMITAVGLGINFSVIWLFTSVAGYYYMVSKLLATFATYWWNFGARKYFLHSGSSEEQLQQV